MSLIDEFNAVLKALESEEKARAKRKAYYVRNKEKLRARRRKYEARNWAKLSEKYTQWLEKYIRNREEWINHS